MGFPIDTCIWVDIEQGKVAPAAIAEITTDAPVFMSPVTRAELQAGAELADDPDIRQRRAVALARLRKKSVLPIDAETAEVMGHIVSTIRRSGRVHRHRIQDLWLASQAIQHGFPLVTRNARDFQDIPGLDLRIVGEH
jgi:predicted nucleic acid-binding protein